MLFKDNIIINSIFNDSVDIDKILNEWYWDVNSVESVTPSMFSSVMNNDEIFSILSYTPTLSSQEYTQHRATQHIWTILCWNKCHMKLCLEVHQKYP